MNLDQLKALVAQHSEKPLRFPEDTPESFWLGYDAATFDFLRLLDEEIAWGEKGDYPGDFMAELEPIVPAGRGLFKKAPHRHIINMLPKLIDRVESRVKKWYAEHRPNINMELQRARYSQDYAETMLRMLNAKRLTPNEAHTANPEYTVDLKEAVKLRQSKQMEELAERARTFIAENVGSTEYRKFDDGSRKRDHSKQADTGGVE